MQKIYEKHELLDGASWPHGQPLPPNLDRLPKWATYDGKPLIKKANVPIIVEDWQIEEATRCAMDIEYFVNNYVYIIDPDKGKCLIDLWDFQKDMIKSLHENRFSVVLASRQIGKSTITSIYLLHYILFNSDKRVVIVANKAKIAKEIFQKVKIAYEKLPYWMQVGVVQWQATSCTLQNGSACSAEATTEEGMRGLTGNIIVLDEFAFIKRGIADEFYTSMYPIISASKESKLIIVSTPNGLNHFHDIYSKAMKGNNTFVPFRIDWWQRPDRDPKKYPDWKKDTLMNIGKRRFAQEFGNEFIGSSKTLINGKVLELMEANEILDLRNGLFCKVYEHPKHGHTYCIGVDTAKGTGGDYSVGQVIDITSFPFKQVAVYRTNEKGTRAFGDDMNELGLLYNEAYMVVENNDIGHGVAQYLWHDLEYENLVNFGGNSREIGVRSTKKSKALALDLLKEYIEDDNLDVQDKDTIYELSKFIEVREGIFKAEEGEHDDCVTALMWALYIVKTPWIDKDEIPTMSKLDYNQDSDDFDQEIMGDDEPLSILTEEDFDDEMEQWL